MVRIELKARGKAGAEEGRPDGERAGAAAEVQDALLGDGALLVRREQEFGRDAGGGAVLLQRGIGMRRARDGLEVPLQLQLAHARRTSTALMTPRPPHRVVGRLYVLRHGETMLNRQRIIQGPRL